MIKPPSLQTEYSVIFSGDPALVLPDDAEERKRALEVARETGNWQPLLGPEQPTVFTLRPLRGSEFDWWQGEVIRRRLVETEAAALALRLAIKRVDNFGAYKVEPAKLDGVPLAKAEIIDAIYAEAGGEGRAIVLELATVVIERATTAPRPKS